MRARAGALHVFDERWFSDFAEVFRLPGNPLLGISAHEVATGFSSTVSMVLCAVTAAMVAMDTQWNTDMLVLSQTMGCVAFGETLLKVVMVSGVMP